MAKSMGMGKIRPPQLRNRLTDFDEIRNLELPPEDHHHARFHFDPTTWVVSVNSQFATVRFLSLSFFGLFVTRTGRTGGPILTIYTSYDVFPPRMCLLGVS